MPEQKNSPLTGNQVEAHHGSDRDIWYFDDTCGRWAITWEAEQDWGQATITDGRLRFTDRILSQTETKRTFALARSEVWRYSQIDAPLPLFMSYSGAKSAEPDPDFRVTILTLEDLEDTSRRLSLEQKAAKTLENLQQFESEPGIGVEVPYLLREFPGEPTWDNGDPPKETGLTYGCTSSEAPLVYHLLESEGLIVIREPEAMRAGSRVFLTPAGYSAADARRVGASTTGASAFFICRFIDELDALYVNIVEPLGQELELPIKRIKDIHHIDKIDDRICQEIRESQIVLVDLTEQNFNVAFEAGYALALEKPIVWTKKREGGSIDMPFDIYTYNCLQWDPENLDEFRESLKYRIRAALNKAKRQ